MAGISAPLARSASRSAVRRALTFASSSLNPDSDGGVLDEDEDEDDEKASGGGGAAGTSSLLIVTHANGE